jgi:hypothetical protein
MPHQPSEGDDSTASLTQTLRFSVSLSLLSVSPSLRLSVSVSHLCLIPLDVQSKALLGRQTNNRL